MNPQNTTVANIYNPSQLSEEELIERFIVRKKIFSKLFKFISEADMKYPETHFLIEGQRGMGKTTLLLRLYYAVKNEPELNTWLVPVIFSEELYGVRTLTDFWETVAEGLEEEEAGFFGLSDKIEQLRDQCDSEDDCERFVFDLLDKQLEQGGKKVILFVDNFVDLIKNMPKKQIQRFREVLQTSPNFRVFVASSVILQSIMEYKEPFYEFFKVERLEGLDKQETENLLLALGKHYKQEKIEQIIREQPGRVETLRRLTGGITRTIILLYEIFTDEASGGAFKDLENVLDRLTPLYKHKMDELSAQHQAIVNAIGLEWSAVGTKEIAKATRLESKLISAQLKQLVESGVIEKVRTHNKNNFYRIQERFFNIWYLMRMGKKKQRTKMLWLVRFFEEWCASEEELKERIEGQLRALKGGKYHTKGALYMAEALGSHKLISLEQQHKLFSETRKYLAVKDKDLLRELSESDIEISEKIISEIHNKQYQNALVFAGTMRDDYYRSLYFHFLYEIISNKNKESTTHYNYCTDSKDEATTKGDLALLYYNIGNTEKAISLLARASVLDSSKAKESLGILYYNEKLYKKALDLFMNLAETISKSHYYNAGLVLQKQQKFKEAVSIYKKATSENKGLANNNIGWIYEHHLNNLELSKTYYELAHSQGLSMGTNNLGRYYIEYTDNIDEAIRIFRIAYEADDYDGGTNLAKAYNGNGEQEKAIEILSNMIDKFPEKVGETFFSLSLIYEEQKNSKKAEEFLTESINSNYREALNYKAWDLFNRKVEKNTAIAYVSKVIEQYSKDDVHFVHTLSTIQLWNDDFKSSIDNAQHFLYNEEAIKGFPDDFQLYLVFLLAKKQHDFLYDYFTGEKGLEFQSKERFLPIWYALMHRMREQYPNEYLKMPPEIAETVQEILQKADKMAVDYA